MPVVAIECIAWPAATSVSWLWFCQGLGDWLHAASAEPSHKEVIEVACSTLSSMARVFSRPDSEVPQLDAKSRTLEDIPPPALRLPSCARTARWERSGRGRWNVGVVLGSSQSVAVQDDRAEQSPMART